VKATCERLVFAQPRLRLLDIADRGVLLLHVQLLSSNAVIRSRSIEKTDCVMHGCTIFGLIVAPDACIGILKLNV